VESDQEGNEDEEEGKKEKAQGWANERRQKKISVR